MSSTSGKKKSTAAKTVSAKKAPVKTVTAAKKVPAVKKVTPAPAAKKAAPAKAPAKKAAPAKAPAKAPAVKAPVKKAAPAKAPAKAPAVKAPVKKAAPAKAPAKAPAVKAPVKKVAPAKAPAVKAPVKKAAPAKAPVKAPAKKAAPAKAPVKAPAKKAAPAKAPVKAPAKKAAPAVKKPAKSSIPPRGTIRTGVPASRLVQEAPAKKVRLLKSEKKHFQELLLQLRDKFNAQLEFHATEALTSLKEGGGGRAGMATHMADLGSDNFRHDFELGLLSDEADVMEMIDEALMRLEESEYGICLDCGQPISKERLLAKPYARYCTKCKSAKESLEEGSYHKR